VKSEESEESDASTSLSNQVKSEKLELGPDNYRDWILEIRN